MLLKLTTPYNPGDADPGVTYNCLHIDQCVYNSTTWDVTIVYDMGTIDAQGNYTPGKASPRVSVTTTEAEISGLVTAMPPPNTPTMLAGQILAYQFLIDQRNRPGTIDLTLPAGSVPATIAANDMPQSSAAAPPAASSSSTDGTTPPAASSSSTPTS